MDQTCRTLHISQANMFIFEISVWRFFQWRFLFCLDLPLTIVPNM